MHYATDVDSMIDMVAAGLGLTVLTHCSAAAVPRSDVALLSIRDPVPQLSASIVWRRDSSRSLAGLFVDVARTVKKAGGFEALQAQVRASL
jgi:DNA-binding transcriptional LysR family regulator